MEPINVSYIFIYSFVGLTVNRYLPQFRFIYFFRRANEIPQDNRKLFHLKSE